MGVSHERVLLHPTIPAQAGGYAYAIVGSIETREPSSFTLVP